MLTVYFSEKMKILDLLFLAIFYNFVLDVSCTKINSTCMDGGSGQTWKMSLERKTDPHTEWVTTLTAEADTFITSTYTTFDVFHSVVEMNGRRKISVKGVSKDSTSNDGKLFFHRRHGKNIAITGDGRTVQKLDLNEPHHSTAFTNRPLKNDELFQIRLDKKNTKYSYSLGIGIIFESPDDIELPPQFWKTSFGWILHNDEIYQNSTAVVKNYGKNINELQVGDRIGVKRSRFGALHFFINGVDEGPALANIPDKVYGLLELWYNAAKATIVDDTYSSG